jgi:N-formylglutamate deformylase
MIYSLRQGSQPLLVSIPHMGTEIPEALRCSYVERALAAEDTDWHLRRLYGFARELGASVLQSAISRYVVDLNRPPDDTPMYPGASNTELCPTRFFSGEPIYRDGSEVAAGEKRDRLERYWQPYHRALQREIDRIRQEHGFVLLWDAHSIRSEIPWLFEGRLPDLNVGTASGHAAHASIADAVVRAATCDGRFSHALNGRFKGGYITRRYGEPAENVHAVQLEMCQYTYMREEPPFDWLDERATEVQPVVHMMVEAALQACRKLYD